MKKLHQSKISLFLENYPIEELAKSTGFQKRKPKKIQALDFLLSFFYVLSSKQYSLRNWAIKLSKLSGQLISFQAIAKKLQIRQLEFVKTIYCQAMNQYMKQQFPAAQTILFSNFGRVLIEDSSCVKLVSSLSESYPGSSNQHKKSCICRIQLCFDLVSNSIEQVYLSTFVKNDLTFSADIIGRIQPKDLIIRDLGYSVIKVFKKINDFGAFFISRYKIGVLLYTPIKEEEFDLVRHLKKLDKKKIKSLDKNLKMGAKEKYGIRLVALKLTPAQADQRRAQARKNRHDNVKVTKKADYLLSWNIFITNVKADVLKQEEIYTLYTLRWHIEMIFKNWKSNFKVDQILQSCRGKNPVKPELLLFLCMAFMTIIYIPKLNHYRKIIWHKYQRHLSPFKFATYLTNELESFFEQTEELNIQLLLKFCCYDKRKDRFNDYEKIYQLAVQTKSKQ